jgi:hypothetical protein
MQRGYSLYVASLRYCKDSRDMRKQKVHTALPRTKRNRSRQNLANCPLIIPHLGHGLPLYLAMSRAGPGRGKPDARNSGPSPAWPDQLPTKPVGSSGRGSGRSEKWYFWATLVRPDSGVGPTFLGTRSSFSGRAAHG